MHQPAAVWLSTSALLVNERLCLFVLHRWDELQMLVQLTCSSSPLTCRWLQLQSKTNEDSSWERKPLLHCTLMGVCL